MYSNEIPGLLRVLEDEEFLGKNGFKHGSAAYPSDSTEATEKAAAKEIFTLGVDDSHQGP